MLKSENLKIRKYKYRDAQNLLETLQDKDLTKNIPVQDMTLEEVTKSIDNYMMQYHLYDHYKYNFVIELNEGSQFIGWCGIGYMDFDKTAYGLSIVLKKEQWNKGYGTEVGQLMIEYIRQMLNHDKIYAYIKEEDQATKRVVEKLGFKFVKKLQNLEDALSFYNNGYYYELVL